MRVELSRSKGGRRLAAVGLLAVVMAMPLSAQSGSRWWREMPSDLTERPADIPSDEELEANGAIIGEIVFHTLDVFDTSRREENNFLFRSANNLHLTTREPVVARKVLFEPGDLFSGRKLKETARYLRALGLFYDVWVHPIDYHDNVVDVAVITRDVWTLTVSGSFSRAGAANTYSAQVADGNFLGFGKVVDLKYEDNPDRSSFRVRYVDNALAGSDFELSTLFSDNSDGYRRTIDLGRPFFSLDTPWAAGLRWVDDDRSEKLYSLGEVARRFQHRHEEYSVSGGLSSGYRNGRSHRWSLGYSYIEDLYEQAADQGRRLPPFKSGRTLSFPWIGFERVRDGFVELEDLDQLNRTEDYNLATDYRLRLGWSSPSFGGDKSRLVAAASLNSGFGRNGTLFLLRLGASGLVDSEDYEDVHAGFAAELYRRTFGRHQFYLRIQANATWNADLEDQLLLGGDTGLRGYPRNVQAGNRLYLVTLEQRFYTDLHLLQLFHVGGAIFFDAGEAWYTDGPLASDQLGLLRDVGIGLRLGSSRSSRGKMIHIDVAYPLDAGFEKVQWLVTARDSF